jgi:XTP/dITP diphosphohydrolase
LRRIILATKNDGKIKEVKAMLEDLKIEILSLNDYKNLPEIKEDGKSFFENALKKAKIISEHTGEMVLSDDSGLEVKYLGGEPGIYSARYSGRDATDSSNIKKLLESLEGVPIEKRGASFRCVLVLYRSDGKHWEFEGVLNGIINDKPIGDAGFGYDPVFFLPELGLTVAQLSPNMKNKISHRAQAVDKFKEAYKRKVFLR